jgi:hypothetical protein
VAQDQLGAANVALQATHGVWGVVLTNFSAIKKEPDCTEVFALTFAECAHQLVETSGSFDFEKDFVVVVGDFDVEVFATTGGRLRLSAVGRVATVRHGCRNEIERANSALLLSRI